MSTENRRHPRQPQKEKLFVQAHFVADDPSLSGLTLPCSSTDISPEGVRTRLPQPLEPGTRLELWVKLAKSSHHFLLLGEVRWSNATAEQEYETGIQLVDAEHTDFPLWQTLFNPSGEFIELPASAGD